ncbi:CHASE domain-containing protein [Noviherbaspirillum suwonense]|uniref:histidine kinase n=1 Tax=Noviherbaspirillum suwonense TaxID=1224511 RepID=A0ABY1QDD6_9BURK|nr:CHASE domain-containing protein [Noviherbaspirillum suwonense]SMP68045.1 PAS domain S-box-containing protein [Noviherbaspirillum suwonense]
MPESQLMEASLERKAPRTSRLTWLLPLIVLVLGLAMTIAAWREARLVSSQEIQRDFDYQVRRITNLLQQRMATYEQVMRGAQGFMRGSTGVDRGDFAGYVATLRLAESFPGIQGIAIAELVPPARLDARVAAVRAEGYPEFKVRPEGERPFYSAIVQIEPANQMNLRALGYDMLTEPVRRAAMEQARDSGLAALSGKLRLVQEQEPHVQNGVIVYLPVYGRGMPVSTISERRASLVAWVGAPFRMNDLMRGLLGERAEDLRLRIFDGAAKSEDGQLYDSGNDDTLPGQAMLDATRRFRIADREWTLSIASTPAFEARFDHSKPLFIAGAGAGISLLLATLVWLLASGRSRALALAGSMTRALRASQLRWQYALEGAGDGVWDWNNHTGEIVLSRRWKEMLGYAESELSVTPATWGDLIHPDDRQGAEQALADYIAGRTSAYSWEMRLRCRDGSWKWILTRGAIVSRDAGGRPMRTIGTHTDISRLKENEEALRASYSRIAAEQRRIRVILENSHDAFIAVGPDERITDWNTQAERTFGWSAQQAIGQSLAGLVIPPAGRAAYLASFASFVQSGGSDFVGRREITALHRDGQEIPVEIALAAVPHEGGYAAAASVRDISDRRRAEEMRAAHERSLEETRAALHHAQKLEAVGKLTGGIAHDFNNVLQIISGYLQLIQRDAGPGSLLQKQLQRALDAVDRGARLSSRLLAFARRQPLQPVVVNLGRLVNGMQDLLHGALGESVSLSVTVADPLWNTLVDRDQLQNVILNLVINARDAMDGAGSLDIALDNASLAAGGERPRPDLPAGEYVLLTLRDSGAGMTPEVRERAFEPFFTTKAEGVGTGLGLSMAYGFIAQSGGHIDIGSAPGEGTTVRIFLPRVDLPEAGLATPASRTASGGTEDILVVEDDESVRASVCAMLEGLGYRVRSAGDAGQALQLLQTGVPADLLFTDVVMPGALRAPDMVREALALRPGLAVLYTSGYTRDAVLHAGAGREALLLKKPYRREQLALKVREALEAAGRQPPPDGGPARVLVVESQEDSRQIACEMLSVLGHAARGVASLAEAEQALAAERYEFLLVAEDTADRGQAQRLAEQGNARLVLVRDAGPMAGDDDGAVVIRKPYSMEKLRAATAQDASSVM